MLYLIIKLHKHSIIYFPVSLGVLFPSFLIALCITVYVHVLYWLFGLMTTKLNKYYYYYYYCDLTHCMQSAVEPPPPAIYPSLLSQALNSIS